MSAHPTARPTAAAPTLPISATLICKNEEACIGKCLSSLQGLSEIVVVDSGSTDGTLAIVADYSRRPLVRVEHLLMTGLLRQVDGLLYRFLAFMSEFIDIKHSLYRPFFS